MLDPYTTFDALGFDEGHTTSKKYFESELTF
jgi:hypothetical protein